MGLKFFVFNRVMPATVTACPAVTEPGVSSSWVKLFPLAGMQDALGAVEDVCGLGIVVPTDEVSRDGDR